MSALSQQVTTGHQQTDVYESITNQDRYNIRFDNLKKSLLLNVQNLEDRKSLKHSPVIESHDPFNIRFNMANSNIKPSL